MGEVEGQGKVRVKTELRFGSALGLWEGFKVKAKVTRSLRFGGFTSSGCCNTLEHKMKGYV